MTTIGERIKEERTSRGLSLYKLSQLSNVSKTYLSEIESGKKANPSADVLLRIASALNVSLPYLIEGDKKDDLSNQPIPTTLKEAALEENWTFAQVLQLLETKNLAIAHRGKKVEKKQVPKEGWKKLFNTLKEQNLI